MIMRAGDDCQATAARHPPGFAYLVGKERNGTKKRPRSGRQ
jgi:hypothetical protein